ncbi:uncharacterized protein LOC117647897 [Thrips palmi]|uniref:Uncharacterized protein LOC117647897 n=1 Tax=Thrips palmi TaxID=161013 RepID=A0A6P8ZC03_THRPL|nr:uncharacterized protein LOC117647897 [Thrips palmi]
MSNNFFPVADLARTAARLVLDLADPAAVCSVTLRRGAAGAVEWRAEVPPADNAGVKLVLCMLGCDGHLTQQPPETQPQEQQAAAWHERPNEGERQMSYREMAAAMAVGCRVARGRDWERGWNYDGPFQRPGTVTHMHADSDVAVHWDCSSGTGSLWFRMGRDGKYHLRLLAPAPLASLVGLQGGDNCLDLAPITAESNLNNMSKKLADGSLAQVRSIVCTSQPFPQFVQRVLEQTSPHLTGLHIRSPLARHLDVVAAMPALRTLCLTSVTETEMRQVRSMASLQSLELHCSHHLPLPVMEFPANPAGLRLLRCGVYPLATALALARAHAQSLENLQLVAASTEPYGCPDLALELRRCGLRKLKRMVLIRHTAFGSFCRHDRNSCRVQKEELWSMFVAVD